MPENKVALNFWFLSGLLWWGFAVVAAVLFSIELAIFAAVMFTGSLTVVNLIAGMVQRNNLLAQLKVNR